MASVTPETVSVSCVIALISASETCASRRAERRRRPTRREMTTKIGTTTSESSVSGIDSRAIAITDETTTTTLESTLAAVVVIVVWTPPTSFCRRDCTSPVRLPVKNDSESSCRCA